MYKVLLVDDETLILSGIKFLIDWERNDCTIIEIANNGRDALEKIKSCLPDIILCDINMPVMTGLELLQEVNDKYPSMVFIMLTNLQEFDLAREALRCRAVDYLLKAQLTAESLEKSLELAKDACRQRVQMEHAACVNYYSEREKQELIQKACLEILFSPRDTLPAPAVLLLKENDMLNGYRMLYLPVDYSGMPGGDSLDAEGKKRMIAWVRELVSKLAGNLFHKKYYFVETGSRDCLILYCYGQKQEIDKLTLFSEKISNASRNIMQAEIRVMATPCFYGEGDMESCKSALHYLIEAYYLEGEGTLIPEKVISYQFEPLGLSGIGSQLESEINLKNITGCTLLLDKAINTIEQTIHQKSQAIWLCNELLRASIKTAPKGGYPGDQREYQEIDNLMTRKQVVFWLERLKNALISVMQQSDNAKAGAIERARQYIHEHIEEHIMLQDVADYVWISPAYLSTLFKKQYNQSFVDYINQEKVECAKKLIEEDRYLIGEIAYRLSFENAYYFARVFRKFTGMSPSEYQKSLSMKRV